MDALTAEESRALARLAERMVTPGEVGRLHGRAELLGRLPRRVQDWVIDKAGGRDARIGFVVEPYATFLAYELTDLEAARRLLPEGYDLLPAAIFADSAPRPMCVSVPSPCTPRCSGVSGWSSRSSPSTASARCSPG